jgi:hypothetical protein
MVLATIITPIMVWLVVVPPTISTTSLTWTMNPYLPLVYKGKHAGDTNSREKTKSGPES